MNLKKLPSMWFIEPKIDWKSSELTLTSPKCSEIISIDLKSAPTKNLNAKFMSATQGKIPYETLIYEEEKIVNWLHSVLVDEHAADSTFAKAHAPFYLLKYIKSELKNNSFASNGDFLFIFQEDVETLLEKLKQNADVCMSADESNFFKNIAQASNLIESIRPNFVFERINKQSPKTLFLEDAVYKEHAMLSIGSENLFKMSKRCSRCPLMNIRNPGFLKNKEPLNTLTEMREHPKDGKINFGILVDGVVSNEDLVKSLETIIESGKTVFEFSEKQC